MAKMNTKILSKELLAIDENFLIHDFENILPAIMDVKNISRADLAQRLGVSQVRVHHMLKTNKNMSLRTIGRICVALDEELHIKSPTLEAIRRKEIRVWQREQVEKAREHACIRDTGDWEVSEVGGQVITLATLTSRKNTVANNTLSEFGKLA